MKKIKRLKTILLVAIAILMAMPCAAQSDGGGKKKKKTVKVKTEQTTSNGSRRKQNEEGRRKQTSVSGQQHNSESQNEGSRRKQTSVSGQQHNSESQNEIINNLISNMVYVEGGSFTMGSDDSDAYKYEKPAHRETVRSFSIGKYEVTQREWKEVMGTNPSHFKGDDLPVENVTWDECQQFIRKLNALTGRNFRLPTESEWEFAARGGNLSNGYKYSGSNDIGNVAWYGDNSGGKTHPVGTKRANELGLHDMSGNVREWTSSNWCEDYSKPRNSSYLVYRGGSWSCSTHYCRVSFRNSDDRAGRYYFLGLRLVF